ncbi:MAG TPA: hypothetical protein VNI01_05185 [Elusimicrobiota bacterium]|jgi:hypothetical protein|nr:hypothetical protein [Elusimicrobiota bacterium]
MAGSVNMPGALALGDLSSTTSVSLGVGGALVVDNTGTGAAGQVSVVGPLSAAGLSVGTGAVTCGALSAGSLTVGSGGTLQCDVGSASAPAVCFGTSSSTGAYRSGASVSFASGGSEVLRVGPSSVRVLAPLSTSGNTFICGAATCSGASCASAASTGAATQPQYALRVLKNANQAVSTATTTAVTWDAAETSGGGSVNWAFTPGASLFTCPKAGMYFVTYQLMYATNSTGIRDTWVEVNPPGGTPGSVRRHAEATLLAATTLAWVYGGSFIYQLALGDTLLVATRQTSGGNLNAGFSGNEVSEFSATRLSE